MWFTLALISALLAGLRKTSEKRLLQHTSQFTLGWLIHAFSLPIMLLAVPFTGGFLHPLSLGPRFWLPMLAGMFIFYPLNTWLAGRAIKHGELSSVMPIQSLGPVLSIPLAFVIAHQVPSTPAVGAIITISVGVYVLNMKGRTLHHPFAPFKRDKASRYMFYSTALIAVFVPIDVVAIKASNSATYGIVSTLSAAAALLYLSHRTKHTLIPDRKIIGQIFVLGTLQGIAYLAVVTALTMGPISYISAVKSSSVLVGALSGIIILKERLTLHKSLAFLGIAAGLLLLAFV